MSVSNPTPAGTYAAEETLFITDRGSRDVVFDELAGTVRNATVEERYLALRVLT